MALNHLELYQLTLIFAYGLIAFALGYCDGASETKKAYRKKRKKKGDEHSLQHHNESSRI